MSELRTVAFELLEEAQALVEEINEFQGPPSRAQIDFVQDRMNRLQRLLNRVQTETDTWSDEKEAVYSCLGFSSTGAVFARRTAMKTTATPSPFGDPGLSLHKAPIARLGAVLIVAMHTTLLRVLLTRTRMNSRATPCGRRHKRIVVNLRWCNA